MSGSKKGKNIRYEGVQVSSGLKIQVREEKDHELIVTLRVEGKLKCMATVRKFKSAAECTSFMVALAQDLQRDAFSMAELYKERDKRAQEIGICFKRVRSKSSGATASETPMKRPAASETPNQPSRKRPSVAEPDTDDHQEEEHEEPRSYQTVSWPAPLGLFAE